MSFDLLAPHYRWMELVLAGEKLQRCRTAFVERAATAKDILILGEGNGRFLCACRRANQRAAITCVDASERMLALARERLRRAGLESRGVEFIHADALAWQPEKRFDLIVTHFFLDCFTAAQLEALVGKLGGCAQTKADWLVADFREPSAGFAKWRARGILASMYLFFRMVARLPAATLTPPDTFLTLQGFYLRQRHIREWGLLHSDWWEKGGQKC